MVRGTPDPRPPARWRSPSPALRLYLLTLLISVTAGCAATLETDIVVREDDSAGVRYELAFQLPKDLPEEAVAEFNRQLEAAQAQAQSAVRAETQRLGIDPGAVTFASFNEHGRLGLRVGIDPIPRQRLSAVLGSGGSDALFRRFAVDRERNGLTLNAELTGEHTLSAPPSAGEQFAASSDVIGARPLTVMVAVRLPGQVTSHNADRVDDDGALVWDGQPQARTLTAQADVAGASTLPLLVAVVALVIIGGLLAVWRRSRGPARPGGAHGWSVTADDPAARGAAFALAPAGPPATGPAPPATPEDVAVPERPAAPVEAAAPDENRVVTEEITAPGDDLSLPDDDLAPPEDDDLDLPAGDVDLPEDDLVPPVGPAPVPPAPDDAAWWLDDDEDLGPVWDDDDRHRADDDELDAVPDDDDLATARENDAPEPAWDDDRYPWDDESSWEADESWDMEESSWDVDEPAGDADDADVHDPSSSRRR